MRNKTRDPLKAIAIMREAYENKELSKQNGGQCEYWDATVCKPCIVGSLINFSKGEKQYGVDDLEDLSTITDSPSDLEIGSHEGAVGGIPTGELEDLQLAHDSENWVALESKLDRLEKKYKKESTPA